MNALLHRHCAKYIYILPDGLRELMSDISREVIRSQPEQIYTFIADYLDALMITRENARVAARLVECITEIGATIVELLTRTGISREDANKAAAIIQVAFRRHMELKREFQLKLLNITKEEEEEYFTHQILQQCGISIEMADVAARIIQDAYRRFRQHEKIEHDLLLGTVDWRVAARSAIYLYRRTGVTLQEANRAATLIKAAYKGYYTRQVMRRLVEEGHRAFNTDIEDYFGEEAFSIGGEEGEDMSVFFYPGDRKEMLNGVGVANYMMGHIAESLEYEQTETTVSVEELTVTDDQNIEHTDDDEATTEHIEEFIDAKDIENVEPVVEAKEDDNKELQVDAKDEENKQPEIDATDNDSKPPEIDATDNDNKPPEIGATDVENKPVEIDVKDDDNKQVETDAKGDENKQVEIDVKDDENKQVEIDVKDDENKQVEIDAKDSDKPVEIDAKGNDNKEPETGEGIDHVAETDEATTADPSKRADTDTEFEQTSELTDTTIGKTMEDTTEKPEEVNTAQQN